MTNQVERRITKTLTSIRSGGRQGTAEGRRLVGYAALFNSRSQDLGGFVEELAPGCFTKALKTSDTRALLNHDSNHILGRSKSGTLRLKEDSVGLRVEIDVPNTATGDGVLESVRRGDISQMSFAFRVVHGKGDNWTTEKDGTTVRRITEVEELIDVSVVSFPAYADTVVAVRTRELAANTGMARTQQRASTSELTRVHEAERENVTALAQLDRSEELRLRDRVIARNLRVLMRVADDEPSMRWMEQVAIHEAGHCLGYWRDGAGIDAVGFDIEEHPTLRINGYARSRDSDLKSAQAILAGIAAERIAGYNPPVSITDKDVTKALRDVSPRRRSMNDIEREIGRTCDWLRRYWPAVTALAAAIRRKTDLTGEEAESIIAQSLLTAERIA